MISKCLLPILLTVALVGQSQAEMFGIGTVAGSPGQEPPFNVNGDGTNSGARFSVPAGVAVDSGGAIYITDAHAVKRISAAGTNWAVTTIAGDVWKHGPTDGTNSDAKFNYPQGIAIDSATNIYVADTYNDTIRKVSPAGTNWVVTTLAGTNTAHGNVDGTNTAALFNHPYGIAVDHLGTLYVADTLNSTLRKVTSVGTSWVVSTISGLATNIGTADGTNSAARFNGPSGLVVEGGTNLYVADFNNNTIRSVTLSGTNAVVRTIAGLGGFSGVSDGTNAAARFFQPQGICRDAFGNLCVSDSGNNTLRKLKRAGTNWVVITIAGQPGNAGAADGVGNAALFDQPNGVGYDSAGRLFIADSVSGTIRSGQVAIALDAKAAGAQLTISWPVAATNYGLEVNGTGLKNGPWTGIATGIGISGDTWFFQTNTAGTQGYFRLHKP